MAAKPFSATVTRTYLRDMEAAGKGLIIAYIQQWQPKDQNTPDGSEKNEKTSA
jgi:hypothetical protein